MSISEAPQTTQVAQPRIVAIKPQEIMLPARPEVFARAVSKSEAAGKPGISINVFTQDALDQHGQKCAEAVSRILEPQVARLNLMAGLFAEKLRALGVDPKDVIEEAKAKQTASKLQ